jgi:hypothetical protein
MIEDNHFGKASLFLKNLILITPKSKVRRLRMVNEVKVPQTLTNEQLNSNNVITRVRDKVETQFG